MTYCPCGEIFDKNKKEYWGNKFCSKSCWQNSEEYLKNKEKLIKFYISLNNTQKKDLILIFKFVKSGKYKKEVLEWIK